METTRCTAFNTRNQSRYAHNGVTWISARDGTALKVELGLTYFNGFNLQSALNVCNL